MALLDFIKNRQSQQPAAENTQQQKPETAKEMYAREAVNEKANTKALNTLPSDEQAKVAGIKERLETSTKHLGKETSSPAAAPSDNASSPQTARQNMSGQDKAAPALSPTTEQSGKTQSETPSKTSDESSKTQSSSPDRSQQTMARHPPSWER